MNRPLFFLAMLGIATMSNAQRVLTNPGMLSTAKAHELVQPENRLDHTPAAVNDLRGGGGAPFWTEDFSGGSIPANWTSVDNGNTAPTVSFQWTNDPTAVDTAALNYAPSSTFNAPTASNGYVWANSDRGIPAPGPQGNHITRLTTPAINCTGQPTVRLRYQALIGVFDLDAVDNAIIRVSTDLTNWTTYTAFPCLIIGSAAPPCSRWSNNPQDVMVDITATAANQPNVYIQWQWTGEWEYFYAIDDIELAPLPDYERSIGNAYQSHVGSGLEYARIPRSQLMTDFILGATVSNNGANPQTNLTITADVQGPGGSTAFIASQTFATVAVGVTDTMEQAVPLPANLAEGTYTVNYSISSDQDADEEDPANDTITRLFELNDNVYSLDGIGVYPESVLSTTSLGSNSFTDNPDGVYLFTYFEVTSALEVHGLEAMLATGTVAGSQVIFSIHDAIDIIDNDDVTLPLAESDFVTLAPWHINAGRVAGAFLGGTANLEPGGYYAAVQLYSNGGAAHVRVLDDTTVPQPGDAGLIYTPVGTVTNPAGVYGNGNAHAIRMVLNNTVGIQEELLSGVTLYPNPTDGTLWIGTGNTENHLVEVRNVMGQLVHTTNIIGLSSIDLSNLGKGVYTVRLANAKGSVTQRVTVQ